MRNLILRYPAEVGGCDGQNCGSLAGKGDELDLESFSFGIDMDDCAYISRPESMRGVLG